MLTMKEFELFDLDSLQTFVAVAEAGGITPGARRLGLSKAVVSRRLKRLEETLGAQLLARTTRGSALTEAGALFREHAARASAELTAALDAIAPDGQLRGVLRIAAPLSFGPTELAPIFSELARRHPLLQVHTSYSDSLVDIVGEGYDAAVRIGHLADSSLVAKRIGWVHGLLVASPDYLANRGAPQTLASLDEHDAVMLRSETWQMTDAGKTVIVHPRGRIKADNGLALTSAALLGLGLALLPDFLVRHHIDSGALVPVLPDNWPPPAPVHVIRPPGARTSRKVTALIEILMENMSDCREQR